MKNTHYLSDWMAGKLEDQKLIEIEGNEAFSNYNKIKLFTQELTLDVPQSLDWDHFSKKLPSKKTAKIISFSWRYPLAASLVLLVGITAFLFSNKTYVSKNKVAEILLSDGSSVTLTPGSRLSHNRFFGWFHRNVDMEGEVAFTVEKGSPFKVNAPSGSIEVLGTTFRVIDADQYFEVLCKEGRVKVTHKEKGFILQNGESYNSVESKILPFDTSFFDIQNQIQYQRVPLSHVLKIVQNTYGIKISFDFSKKYYFTGLIPLNNQKTALASVSIPFNFDLEKDQNGNWILKEN